MNGVDANDEVDRTLLGGAGEFPAREPKKNKKLEEGLDQDFLFIAIL